MSELSRTRRGFYQLAFEHSAQALEYVEFAIDEHPPERDREKLLRIKAYLKYSLPFLRKLPKNRGDSR